MEANQIQPVLSVRVAASMIVPEVLKEDNYVRWRIFMQHYLVAQDLWDVVLSNEMLHGEDSREWIKRNALALHTIKISCGAKEFDLIKEMNSPKDAWNALADLHKQPNEDASSGSEADTEVKETRTRILDNNERTTIVSSLHDGNWNALKNLDRITEILFPGGFTVLHIATILGHLKIVNELVKITGEDYLEIQDDNGDTALSLAAFNGEVEIAECLIQKHDKLLTIQNKEGYIPLVVACINKQKDMTSYLYSKTGFQFFLLPGNSNHGALFLKYCALNFMLVMDLICCYVHVVTKDVGLDLYLRCPCLAARQDSITILELSAQPSLFLSGTPLSVGERKEYRKQAVVKLPSPSDNADTSELERFERQVARVEMDRIFRPVVWLLPRRYRRLVSAVWLQPTMDERRRIYNLKLTHTYANLVLCHLCKEISTYRDATQLVESGAISAIFQAIKDGTSEIVIEILKANADLFWCNEKLSIAILISAIKCHRGDILEFVYGLDGFKSCLPSWCHEAENRYGETPEQVFKKEHAQLAKKVEEWVKKTAESYTLASVLIVTIMFAALFTVPGGNNDTGVPILSDRKLFLGFLVCDTVSFLTASTSLLGFLTELTVRADQRREPLFRVPLLGSLFIAPFSASLFCMAVSIILLIISVVTMILAFTFALILTLEDKWRVLLAIIAYLASVGCWFLSAWESYIDFLFFFARDI
ncbi:hypothetical protein SLEP1_g42676 [Rubroshorea leprosula]|uniref:PGG domain-containing protein n=1 Tax=Rubroshorea leprosula TaxID=152421 RepID=A0AAV5LAL8_9ROSI|nr:hypothetical protein SLEP1_g42676 [Rubroshorea leprosula]